MARALAAAVVCAWLLLGTPVQAALEVFRPQHRTAEELLPLAETALGEQGRAVLDRGTGSLVLAGSEVAVADALALLERQDVRRRMVLLEYESRTLGDLAAAGIDVAWSIERPGFRVGTTGQPGVQAGVRALRTGRDRVFQGSARVLEGEQAFLARGREVPVRSRDRFGRGTVEFAAAEQGFHASPRVLGDGRIQVEITPSDSRVDDRGRTEFLAGATTVVVASGETLALSGISRSDVHRHARTGRSFATEVDDETRILLLRVTVED
ncbi:MAG: hypothetical protein OEP95_01225 [Myxococcales bacterium]|nr:hypothetical protein [Myxococcales bacterium]